MNFDRGSDGYFLLTFGVSTRLDDSDSLQDDSVESCFNNILCIQVHHTMSQQEDLFTSATWYNSTLGYSHSDSGYLGP